MRRKILDVASGLFVAVLLSALLVPALMAVSGCGKKEEAPAPAASPSILGKWVHTDDRGRTAEIEFFADGTVDTPNGTGEYKKLDEKKLRLEREEFEFAVSADELYLTNARRNETLRFRRGTATPEDREKREAALRNAKSTLCANNLSQLWKMQNNYMVIYGGPQKRMPRETGGAFWLKLSRPPTVLIDRTLEEIYLCPFKERERSGVTDYRGPSADVNAYGDGDPVGACIGNHPDGTATILRKSGDVQTVKESDPLYRLAQERTGP